MWLSSLQILIRTERGSDWAGQPGGSFQLGRLSLRGISLIDMRPALCFTPQVNRCLLSNNTTAETAPQTANPRLESLKPSAVWHSRSLLLSLTPKRVAWRLYPPSQNIGSSNILIPLWKLIFPSWLMLICFLCGRDQKIIVIRARVKTRTLFGSDRA